MVTIEDAEAIARQMLASAKNLDVQVAQTLFRMQLVEQWRIPEGVKVLEIGCGQGDMTAVLSNAVGYAGHVTAVDSAPPNYGAPVSLGQSALHLESTPLGQRIAFLFQYDLLNPSRSFSADQFDYVILAHCSWYFATLDQLRQVLLRVRPWASRLCFSEWDLEPYTLDQFAHLLAVLIQGQVEAYKDSSESNIRTPLSRSRLKQLLQETGWHVSAETMLDSTPLKDVDWEIDSCLKTSLTEAESLHCPVKLREWLGSQVDILRQVAGRGKNRSLGSYAIVAQRSPEIHR